MRFISNLDQHPEIRKKRFPMHLWPGELDATTVDEWWTLLEFLYSAGLPIEKAPIKLAPPSPDFECSVEGKKRLFELGEILDSSLAKGLAHSGKEAQRKMEARSRGEVSEAESIKTDGRCSFSANGSLERMLGKKLAKSMNAVVCHATYCSSMINKHHKVPSSTFLNGRPT